MFFVVALLIPEQLEPFTYEFGSEKAFTLLRQLHYGQSNKPDPNRLKKMLITEKTKI